MTDIEEQIRRAMQEGKFSNLRGKGKPLNLDENPLADPEWRMAYHILQEGGYTLPWIEARREIEAELQAARQALQRAWSWRQSSGQESGSPTQPEGEWRRALEAFQEQVAALNQKIFAYNLEAPSDRFQLPPLRLERELARLTAAPLSDTL